MGTSRKWRYVDADAVTAWGWGKIIKSISGGGFDLEVVTEFKDGSALRVTAVSGQVYSEHTADSDEVTLEIADPPNKRTAPPTPEKP